MINYYRQDTFVYNNTGFKTGLDENGSINFGYKQEGALFEQHFPGYRNDESVSLGAAEAQAGLINNEIGVSTKATLVQASTSGYFDVPFIGKVEVKGTIDYGLGRTFILGSQGVKVGAHLGPGFEITAKLAD